MPGSLKNFFCENYRFWQNFNQKFLISLWKINYQIVKWILLFFAIFPEDEQFSWVCSCINITLEWKDVSRRPRSDSKIHIDGSPPDCEIQFLFLLPKIITSDQLRYMFFLLFCCNRWIDKCSMANCPTKFLFRIKIMIDCALCENE